MKKFNVVIGGIVFSLIACGSQPITSGAVSEEKFNSSFDFVSSLSTNYEINSTTELVEVLKEGTMDVSQQYPAVYKLKNDHGKYARTVYQKGVMQTDDYIHFYVEDYKLVEDDYAKDYNADTWHINRFRLDLDYYDTARCYMLGLFGGLKFNQFAYDDKLGTYVAQNLSDTIYNLNLDYLLLLARFENDRLTSVVGSVEISGEQQGKFRVSTTVDYSNYDSVTVNLPTNISEIIER